ncbi:MAG: NAD(P)H-dependent oxidoreductase subunit E [Terracidiphilus sp.]|nr:NAD(P)H-dependent oxidoreductase subunit E [Terracidiphilus sp.]
MPFDNGPVEIVVCHGTSCFARGNSENLAIVKSFAQCHGDVAVRLSGKLCQNQCADGPNLLIGGKLHHGVTAARLLELLQRLDDVSGSDHGTS